jgi:hypothetical protein
VASTQDSFRKRLLIEALIVLAAEPGTQVAWLARHGVMPDEIALDFDHALGTAQGLLDEGRLDRGALADLREIDSVLSEMSGAEHADRWTTDALFADAGWSRVRQAARRILVAQLGEWQQPLPVISVVR